MPRPMRQIRFYLLSSLAVMLVMVTFFTLYYYAVEPGLTLFDAFYFTIITTRTIGFGDIYPTTVAGKIGTVLNALLPATIFLGVSLVILESVFRHLEHAWKLHRMTRYKDHTIVVADPESLPSIVAECRVDHRRLLVIGQAAYAQLPDAVTDLLPEGEYLQGDPAEDSVLRRAQVDQAKSILIATADDTKNLYVLVTAKGLNPTLMTVVRVNRQETGAKFKAVGADCLLPTGSILGRMLSQAATNPVSHHFLLRLYTHTENPFLAEIPVAMAEVGHPVQEVQPRAIAVYRDRDYLYDLQDLRLQANDVILAIALKPPEG